MSPQQTTPYNSGFLNFLSRHRWLARIFLLLLPVGFFVLLEGGLRIVDYGQTSEPFIPFQSAEGYLGINQELGRRFFPTVGVAPASSKTDAILEKKPDESFRIFALGGSTMAGYPYLFNASFPSLMRGMLQEAYPDKLIEVANLGMSAVPSYAVRDIAQDLEKYEPDMLVVYSGHNEFYGALGVASAESLGRRRSTVLSYLYLYRFKTVQLLSNLIRSGRSALRSAIAPENVSGTLMERMAGDRYISYNSEIFQKAAENFRANLQDVADVARAQDIPLLIGTLVSNIRDQRPFVDVFADELSRADWQQTYNRALAFFQQKNWNACLSELNNCIEIDSLPASQYYIRGEVYEQLEKYAMAKVDFYKAKEFDGLRFRAAEHLNDIIWEFDALPHVTVIDVKRSFELASSNEIPGKTLLLEHLHPNVEGYEIMARSYTATILAKAWLTKPHISEADSLLQTLPVTEADREAGKIRIDYLMQGWPFTDRSAPPVESYRIANPSKIQQLALQYWREEISWEELHVQAAEYYQKKGKKELAAKEYLALKHALGMNTSIYPLLAKQYRSMGALEEALKVVREQLKHETSAEACTQMGALLLQLERPNEALVYLEKAADLKSPSLNLRFLLAKTYAATDRKDKARVFASRLGWKQSDIEALLNPTEPAAIDSSDTAKKEAD
ncbi:MAG: hypothetical protein ACRBF0_21055 [Calditrichia bacterium]